MNVAFRFHAQNVSRGYVGLRNQDWQTRVKAGRTTWIIRMATRSLSAAVRSQLVMFPMLKRRRENLNKQKDQ